MAKPLVLTDKDILEEIEVFLERIQAEKIKINELPKTGGSWKINKKIRDRRRSHLAEIKHVENLIEIAKGALSGELSACI